MKIQVNGTKQIPVDAPMARSIEGEVRKALARFAAKLTRVEVHLTDVDGEKTGSLDKRCLIEARPAGANPRSVSANATEVAIAIGSALGKMQRSLTTFFGRRGRAAVTGAPPVSAVRKASAGKKPAAPRKKTVARKAGAKKPPKLSPRGPKKKRIFQARRKAWPAR